LYCSGLRRTLLRALELETRAEALRDEEVRLLRVVDTWCDRELDARHELRPEIDPSPASRTVSD
jgi:hypothetical protein